MLRCSAFKGVGAHLECTMLRIMLRGRRGGVPCSVVVLLHGRHDTKVMFGG